MSPTRGDFAEVVRANYDRIYRGAVCLAGEADSARDLVQETFYLALRSYASFDGRSSELTWLYRILIRVHGRILRRERLRRRLGFQRFSSRTHGPRERDEDAGRSDLSREEEKRRVRSALGRLSPRLQTVVSMHYFEGLPLKEIAGVLGCPLGTVKSRLFLARRRLRDILKS